MGAVADLDSPETLDVCPSCGDKLAGLRHFVCHCPATGLLWGDFAQAAGYHGPREDVDKVWSIVFGCEADPAARGLHVSFIGTIADRLAGRPHTAADDDVAD